MPETHRVTLTPMTAPSTGRSRNPTWQHCMYFWKNDYELISYNTFFLSFFVMIKICKHACCLKKKKKIQKSCNNHLWFFGSWQSSSGCDPKPLRFVVWQHWTDQTQEQRRTTFKTLFFFFPWLVQLSCSGLGGCFMAWKYVLRPGNRDTHGRKRERKEKTKWVKVFDMALKWKLKYERTKISSLDEILRSKRYIFSY